MGWKILSQATHDLVEAEIFSIRGFIIYVSLLLEVSVFLLRVMFH